VWATPNPGFTVEVKDSGPEDVDVEFESDEHRSRLRVRCENGQQRPAASEEDSSSGPG
jgi:hypothetical protein